MDNSSSQEDNKLLNEWMDRYENQNAQAANGFDSNEQGKYDYGGSMTQQYTVQSNETNERSTQ
jgi:hypothetical protein